MMNIRQISVFLENKKGRLASLTRALSEKGINLITLSIADTTNFGILRCIVSDTDLALEVIREHGFTANVTQVLAVQVPDKPGGIAEVLSILSDAQISIEYLYSFVRMPHHNAWAMFRAEEFEKAVAALTEHHIQLLTEQDMAALEA